MSTLSIHPIEHRKPHLHYEEFRAGFLTALRSFVKKILESLMQAATIAVVLLTVGLVIFGLMKIGESAMFAASYNNAITEVAFPPLRVIPMGQ